MPHACRNLMRIRQVLFGGIINEASSTVGTSWAKGVAKAYLLAKWMGHTTACRQTSSTSWGLGVIF